MNRPLPLLMTPKAKDILWKGIIEDLFADFLRFFYAGADEIFDMERGFEFLDKGATRTKGFG